jgi:hypothetical protein
LLNFLKLNVIVNNKDIYPLLNDGPVLVPVSMTQPIVVATDGFHHSKPLRLLYKEPGYCTVYVSCRIENAQLGVVASLLVILYLLGFFTGVLFFKIMSFVPILIVLFAYYINRKEFIKLVPVQ